jgi:hypothetical protein
VRQDLATGELFESPIDEPWIGHECASDADCGFKAEGKSGSCLVSGGLGFCTTACEGYCPDRAGEAPTFCASLGGKGRCVAKAAVENEGCAAIPGTAPRTVSRFIGSSGAAVKVATACTF